MICARCNLTLAPGSSHTTESSCIEALRAALDRCARCGGAVGCLSCRAKAIVRDKVDQRVPGLGQALRFIGDVMRTDGGAPNPPPRGGSTLG